MPRRPVTPAPAPVRHPLDPVWRADARVLILGSLPGRASLAARAYYAHPRNLFWDILGAHTGAGPERPYPERLDRLVACRIALWDVVAACVRPGSLDAAIDPATVSVQPLAELIAKLPALRAILFNGTTAARLFARHVAPDPRVAAHPAVRLTLPSTSPAMAALAPADKKAKWLNALMRGTDAVLV